MTNNELRPEVRDFVAWAVGHAKETKLAEGGYLCGISGIDPWKYLMGTYGQIARQKLLDAKFDSYYSKHGWSREEYDRTTEGWVAEGAICTDCEGLLDCWMHGDVNADYNYRKYCKQKGLIAEVNRPWIIGEAVFNGTASKKTHVGWVCGFDANGVPLVVEARGIRYGVVITSMATREWKYRGLMTEIFSYAESELQPGSAPFVFTRTLKAGVKGDDVIELKRLLIAHGYTDGISVDTKNSKYYGAKTRKTVKAFQADAGLTIDGKAGKKTIRALGGIFS